MEGTLNVPRAFNQRGFIILRGLRYFVANVANTLENIAGRQQIFPDRFKKN
jgi:hypothetical protein